jgi:hypothetical protein
MLKLKKRYYSQLIQKIFIDFSIYLFCYSIYSCIDLNFDYVLIIKNLNLPLTASALVIIIVTSLIQSQRFKSLTYSAVLSNKNQVEDFIMTQFSVKKVICKDEVYIYLPKNKADKTEVVYDSFAIKVMARENVINELEMKIHNKITKLDFTR